MGKKKWQEVRRAGALERWELTLKTGKYGDGTELTDEQKLYAEGQIKILKEKLNR